jgi:hypothetical protein
VVEEATCCFLGGCVDPRFHFLYDADFVTREETVEVILNTGTQQRRKKKPKSCDAYSMQSTNLGNRAWKIIMDFAQAGAYLSVRETKSLNSLHEKCELHVMLSSKL